MRWKCFCCWKYCPSLACKKGDVDMAAFLKKLVAILTKIYSYGILLCLFAGGLTVLGFIAAFIIGGDTATAICVFIQKKVFGILIYGSNIVVCLGLLTMYLKKQKSLTVNDENRQSN